MSGAYVDNSYLPYRSAEWWAHTERWRGIVLVAATVLACLALAAFVLLSPVVSPIVVVTWLVVVAMAWRPRIGLFVAFALVPIFEQDSLDPLMLPGNYIHGGVAAKIGIPGIITSPLELLLILTFLMWLAQGAARQRLDFRGGTLLTPMLLFLGALVLGLVRGRFGGGGNNNIALWESRFLFYTVICFFIAANTVRRYHHVTQLLTLGLVSMGIYAVEGWYRRVAFIDKGLMGDVKEFYYSHDSVIFLGAAMILVIALLVYRTWWWQRLLALIFLAPVLYTLMASERRAGQIAAMVAFLAVAMVFCVANRKAFCLFVIPVLLGAAIYMPLFWNNTSTLGQPARAVRSMYKPDQRDFMSNLSRAIEKFNIRSTIKANKLFGVGFGREYYFVIQPPDLSWWPFWHYETHANVLWIWLKTGPLGFIAFWILINSAIARAAHLAKTLTHPQTRAFALLTLGGIIATLTFSYVDLGFTSGRITVFFGTLLGTLSVLDKVES